MRRRELNRVMRPIGELSWSQRREVLQRLKAAQAEWLESLDRRIGQEVRRAVESLPRPAVAPATPVAPAIATGTSPTTVC